MDVFKQVGDKSLELSLSKHNAHGCWNGGQWGHPRGSGQGGLLGVALRELSARQVGV